MKTNPRLRPPASKPAEPLPSPEEVHARLIAAARDKLRLGIEGPLTPESLMFLERTIKLVRQMLVLGRDTKALNLEQAMEAVGFPGYDLPMPGDTNAGGAGVPAVTPATSAEQFGASAIRQIVSGLSGPKKSAEPTTVDLIHALSEARKEGLDDVANDLRAQIKARTRPPIGRLLPPPRIVSVTAKGKRTARKSSKGAKAS